MSLVSVCGLFLFPIKGSSYQIHSRRLVLSSLDIFAVPLLAVVLIHCELPVLTFITIKGPRFALEAIKTCSSCCRTVWPYSCPFQLSAFQLQRLSKNLQPQPEASSEEPPPQELDPALWVMSHQCHGGGAKHLPCSAWVCSF